MAGHPDLPQVFLLTSVDIPFLEKPEDWKIQCLLTTWGATHAESNEERLRLFKESASKYAEPWRSAALWLSDDTYIPPDQIRYWADPVIWPNWDGKVTLAGDAAHPMTPFRGQGLNNALMDAHNYVQAIVAVKDGKEYLAKAVSEYSNEALERGAKEIKLSGTWALMLHDWNSLMDSPVIRRGYGKSKAVDETKAEKEAKELPRDVLEPDKVETAQPETKGARQEPSPNIQPEKDVEQPTTTIENGAPHKPTSSNSSTNPHTPEAKEELSNLRKENEILRKRNVQLVEKLKAIQSLVGSDVDLS